jgi:tetratricopeptide (TPR) repeat protein
VAGWAGRGIRKVLVDWRVYVVSAAVAAGVILANQDLWVEAACAFGTGVALMLAAAAMTARRRLHVGDFATLPPGKEEVPGDPPQVDLANLLQVELSRLGSLFRVVEDRRAVSSGLGPGRALDATLSVDDLVGTLQEAVSAETKVAIGPVSIPVAPFMTLAGRAVRAPKLTGSLHRDGDTLILTAQQQGRGGLSWRVTRPAPPPEPTADPEDAAAAHTRAATLSAMVTELALRIFTDFALGREVRWQASQNFVQGLNRFRACLRTPKDRKVNLKEAERLFLEALSEDEDFPLVYYNLGVVYTELHGLAVAAGRNKEADMYLSAAEVSFGWAIDKDPERWETYQAFAQTQMHYERHSIVIELCGRICELKPPMNHRARANELRARAFLDRGEQAEDPGVALGDRRRAIANARRATRLAVRALVRARLFREAAPDDDDDRVPRCEELVGACARTFATCYSKQLPSAADLDRGSRLRRWRRYGFLRRSTALVAFADSYLVNAADLHFEFGKRALNRGLYMRAERELRLAVQSDPTRPTYAAALALARARDWGAGGRSLTQAQRTEIESRCERALRDMAGAFFPLRDADACELIARVHDELAADATGQKSVTIAKQLRDIAKAVGARLDDAISGASVAAFFLEELQAVDPPWDEKLSEYGTATRDARALLMEGQSKLPGGENGTEPDRDRALEVLRAALGDAERASALNPLSSLAWETLGDVHAELSDFRNARQAWRYALGRDPDNPELYDKIGSSHWQLAFQGHSGILREELEQAAEYFLRALRLYGSGSFQEQVRAHYRLGKLYTALRRFSDALPHLQIVEAVAQRPPLVGWTLLGLGHLEQRAFSECEYHFRQVIRHGTDLADELATDPDADPRLPFETIVGDRLDEREWPLALIRAWAHVGMAFSFTERDGNLEGARGHLRHARALATGIPDDPDLFPTRIRAACDDCDGYIEFKAGRIPEAIELIERAIGGFPYSRTYLNLALVYEERARRAENGARDADLRAARRFLDHAVSLGPEPKPSTEVQEALGRIEALAGA